MKPLALVVEGEPLVRSFVCYVFEEEGFDVLEAGNANEAWPLFDAWRQRIHIVFADQDIRPKDGLDFYHRIREQAPSLNVIVSSAAYDPRLIQLDWDPHGYFLIKPFSVDKLRELIHEPSYESSKSPEV